jgi:hypothetical protein
VLVFFFLVNLLTVPLLDQPLQLSGTRERKKVQRFTEEFKSEPKDAVVIEIPEGKGTALGDIPRIDAVLQVSVCPMSSVLFRVQRQGWSYLHSVTMMKCVQLIMRNVL